VRGKPVVAPVPGQECHPAAGDLTHQNGLTRIAERGLDLHLVGIGKELVETRTPDDPDVGDRSHAGQATFAPEEAEDEPAEEEEPEEEDFSPPPFSEEEEEEEEGEEEDDESEEPPDEELEDAGADEDDDPFLLSVR